MWRRTPPTQNLPPGSNKRSSSNSSNDDNDDDTSTLTAAMTSPTASTTTTTHHITTTTTTAISDDTTFLPPTATTSSDTHLHLHPHPQPPAVLRRSSRSSVLNRKPLLRKAASRSKRGKRDGAVEPPALKGPQTLDRMERGGEAAFDSDISNLLERVKKIHTTIAHPYQPASAQPPPPPPPDGALVPSNPDDPMAAGNAEQRKCSSGVEEEAEEEDSLVLEPEPEAENDVVHASVEAGDAYPVKTEEGENAQRDGDQKAQRSQPSGAGFSSMGSMYGVTGAGLYRCTVCGQETRDRSNMRKHVLRWHAGEQKHQCQECGKAFSFAESLKFHMKVHVDPNSRAFERTPQGLYRCKACGRECRNRSNVVKHVNRRHLRAGEKPYRCSQCPATFGYARSLRRHEMVHEGVRPYRCSECNKRFFDPTALRTHSRVHSDERPYACQLCGNRFRQKEGLKGHMRSHTGDKPYVCDRCGMAFAAKRSLTRHIRVHTGERPYPCDQCVAAFADWTTLHNHKLVHRQDSDDDDNSTTNTTTTTTTTLADPNTTHTPDTRGQGQRREASSENRPYQCQFCGIRYRDPLTLKRHLRVHTAKANQRPSLSATAAAAAAAAARRRRNLRKGGKDSSDGGGGGGGGGGETGGVAVGAVGSPALHLQYRPYACESCGERFKHLRGYDTHRKKRHLDHHGIGATLTLPPPPPPLLAEKTTTAATATAMAMPPSIITTTTTTVAASNDSSSRVKVERRFVATMSEAPSHLVAIGGGGGGGGSSSVPSMSASSASSASSGGLLSTRVVVEKRKPPLSFERFRQLQGKKNNF
ncbi:uncharacterized protein LOC143276845 [Babylonia areolata]|uniref:uncharacterized protein LOC143276845 n=1 Tax=Babylonia areolata TaxID=304850 RepID=UPI003FD0E1B6